MTKRKKSMLMAVLVMISLGACKPNVDSNKFLIEGQLSNVPDSVVVRLKVNNSENALDTVINGHFSFTDTISEVRELALWIVGKGFPNHRLPVWVAPGKFIQIKGEDKLLSTWIVSSDIAEQKDQNALQACAMDMRKQYAALAAEETCTHLEKFEKKNRNDTAFIRRSNEKIRSLRKISIPLLTQIYKAEIEYMKTMSHSQVWMGTFLDYAKCARLSPAFMPYMNELKALYETLPEELKLSKQGRLAYDFLYPTQSVKIGDSITDETLYDIQNHAHHLTELAGRYILLDFWSNGCQPCVMSIPEMGQIAEQMADSVAVVSISLDPLDTWKEATVKHGIKWHSWNDLKQENGIFARFGVKAYPTYVLVSPDGKLIGKQVGYSKGSLFKFVKETIEKHNKQE